jgi:uncharacterized OB-fold protein
MASTDTAELPVNLVDRFTKFVGQGQLCYPRGRESGRVYSLDRHELSIIEDIEWLPASGRALLHSFAVYHQQYSPEFTVPFVVAHVELDEGPRLIARLTGHDAALLNIGMNLRAEFSRDHDLFFRPEIRAEMANRDEWVEGKSFP